MIFDFNAYLPGFATETATQETLRQTLREYLNCKYVSLVVNGTIALEIALRASGLKRGTKVIIPDLSFIATATAVANCGMIPLYADISEAYFGLTLESVQQQYDSAENVGAVILVHFGGFVNREIFEIKEFCQEKKLFLIEDCAQVLPCAIHGKRVGTIGDIGTFSLQSSKIVNCGEGGLITTSSEILGQRCESISNWGLSFPGIERDLSIPSSNFRMSAIQSFFVLKQLEILDQIVAERNDQYLELRDLARKFGLEPALPQENPDIIDCPFFFPMKSKQKLNMVEPRTEYPMRQSTMVQAILDFFHPDLLEIYQQQKHGYPLERTSDRVIREVDFINFRNCEVSSPEEVISQYLTPVNANIYQKVVNS
ncbi:MAG TPA: DegT/DnrJ/EryC1/StrS family aminotransferase [Bacillota bacterium]|nr:DegT/DnrJ/EryC1/StrS family aminotransferase [Bacillota bacterium]